MKSGSEAPRRSDKSDGPTFTADLPPEGPASAPNFTRSASSNLGRSSASASSPTPPKLSSPPAAPAALKSQQGASGSGSGGDKLAGSGKSGSAKSSSLDASGAQSPPPQKASVGGMNGRRRSSTAGGAKSTVSPNTPPSITAMPSLGSPTTADGTAVVGSPGGNHNARGAARSPDHPMPVPAIPSARPAATGAAANQAGSPGVAVPKIRVGPTGPASGQGFGSGILPALGSLFSGPKGSKGRAASTADLTNEEAAAAAGGGAASPRGSKGQPKGRSEDRASEPNVFDTAAGASSPRARQSGPFHPDSFGTAPTEHGGAPAVAPVAVQPTAPIIPSLSSLSRTAFGDGTMAPSNTNTTTNNTNSGSGGAGGLGGIGAPIPTSRVPPSLPPSGPSGGSLARSDVFGGFEHTSSSLLRGGGGGGVGAATMGSFATPRLKLSAPVKTFHMRCRQDRRASLWWSVLDVWFAALPLLTNEIDCPDKKFVQLLHSKPEELVTYLQGRCDDVHVHTKKAPRKVLRRILLITMKRGGLGDQNAMKERLLGQFGLVALTSGEKGIPYDDSNLDDDDSDDELDVGKNNEQNVPSKRVITGWEDQQGVFVAAVAQRENGEYYSVISPDLDDSLTAAAPAASTGMGGGGGVPPPTSRATTTARGSKMPTSGNRGGRAAGGNKLIKVLETKRDRICFAIYSKFQHRDIGYEAKVSLIRAIAQPTAPESGAALPVVLGLHRGFETIRFSTEMPPTFVEIDLTSAPLLSIHADFPFTAPARKTLKKIVLPQSIVFIGDQFCAGCDVLETVTVTSTFVDVASAAASPAGFAGVLPAALASATPCLIAIGNNFCANIFSTKFNKMDLRACIRLERVGASFCRASNALPLNEILLPASVKFRGPHFAAGLKIKKAALKAGDLDGRGPMPLPSARPGQDLRSGRGPVFGASAAPGVGPGRFGLTLPIDRLQNLQGGNTAAAMGGATFREPTAQNNSSFDGPTAPRGKRSESLTRDRTPDAPNGSIGGPRGGGGVDSLNMTRGSGGTRSVSNRRESGFFDQDDTAADVGGAQSPRRQSNANVQDRTSPNPLQPQNPLRTGAIGASDDTPRSFYSEHSEIDRRPDQVGLEDAFGATSGAIGDFEPMYDATSGGFAAQPFDGNQNLNQNQSGHSDIETMQVMTFRQMANQNPDDSLWWSVLDAWFTAAPLLFDSMLPDREFVQMLNLAPVPGAEVREPSNSPFASPGRGIVAPSDLIRLLLAYCHDVAMTKKSPRKLLKHLIDLTLKRDAIAVTGNGEKVLGVQEMVVIKTGDPSSKTYEDLNDDVEEGSALSNAQTPLDPSMTPAEGDLMRSSSMALSSNDLSSRNGEVALRVPQIGWPEDAHFVCAVVLCATSGRFYAVTRDMVQEKEKRRMARTASVSSGVTPSPKDQIPTPLERDGEKSSASPKSGGKSPKAGGSAFGNATLSTPLAASGSRKGAASKMVPITDGDADEICFVIYGRCPQKEMDYNTQIKLIKSVSERTNSILPSHAHTALGLHRSYDCLKFSLDVPPAFVSLDLSGSSLMTIHPQFPFDAANRSSLKSVVLPTSVLFIGDQFCAGCEALETISFADASSSSSSSSLPLAGASGTSDPESRSKSAQKKKKPTTKRVIPKLIAIGDGFCAGVTSKGFTKMDLRKCSSLEWIGSSFCRGSKVTSVALPVNIAHIGPDCCADCPAVKTVSITKELLVRKGATATTSSAPAAPRQELPHPHAPRRRSSVADKADIDRIAAKIAAANGTAVGAVPDLPLGPFNRSRRNSRLTLPLSAPTTTGEQIGGSSAPADNGEAGHLTGGSGQGGAGGGFLAASNAMRRGHAASASNSRRGSVSPVATDRGRSSATGTPQAMDDAGRSVTTGAAVDGSAVGTPAKSNMDGDVFDTPTASDPFMNLTLSVPDLAVGEGADPHARSSSAQARGQGGRRRSSFVAFAGGDASVGGIPSNAQSRRMSRAMNDSTSAHARDSDMETGGGDSPGSALHTRRGDGGSDVAGYQYHGSNHAHGASMLDLDAPTGSVFDATYDPRRFNPSTLPRRAPMALPPKPESEENDVIATVGVNFCANTKALETIDLSDSGVRTVGDGFAARSAVKSIKLPVCVERIGDKFCSGVTSQPSSLEPSTPISAGTPRAGAKALAALEKGMTEKDRKKAAIEREKTEKERVTALEKTKVIIDLSNLRKLTEVGDEFMADSTRALDVVLPSSILTIGSDFAARALGLLSVKFQKVPGANPGASIDEEPETLLGDRFCADTPHVDLIDLSDAQFSELPSDIAQNSNVKRLKTPVVLQMVHEKCLHGMFGDSRLIIDMSRSACLRAVGPEFAAESTRPLQILLPAVPCFYGPKFAAKATGLKTLRFRKAEAGPAVRGLRQRQIERARANPTAHAFSGGGMTARGDMTDRMAMTGRLSLSMRSMSQFGSTAFETTSVTSNTVEPENLTHVLLGPQFCAETANVDVLDFTQAPLIELPDGFAFKADGLKSIRFPAGLLRIGEQFCAQVHGDNKLTLDLTAAVNIAEIRDGFALEASQPIDVILPTTTCRIGDNFAAKSTGVKSIKSKKTTPTLTGEEVYAALYSSQDNELMSPTQRQISPRAFSRPAAPTVHVAPAGRRASTFVGPGSAAATVDAKTLPEDMPPATNDDEGDASLETAGAGNATGSAYFAGVSAAPRSTSASPRRGFLRGNASKGHPTLATTSSGSGKVELASDRSPAAPVSVICDSFCAHAAGIEIIDLSEATVSDIGAMFAFKSAVQEINLPVGLERIGDNFGAHTQRLSTFVVTAAAVEADSSALGHGLLLSAVSESGSQMGSPRRAKSGSVSSVAALGGAGGDMTARGGGLGAASTSSAAAYAQLVAKSRLGGGPSSTTMVGRRATLDMSRKWTSESDAAAGAEKVTVAPLQVTKNDGVVVDGMIVGNRFLFRSGLQNIDLRPMPKMAEIGDDFCAESAVSSLHIGDVTESVHCGLGFCKNTQSNIIDSIPPVFLSNYVASRYRQCKTPRDLKVELQPMVKKLNHETDKVYLSGVVSLETYDIIHSRWRDCNVRNSSDAQEWEDIAREEERKSELLKLTKYVVPVPEVLTRVPFIFLFLLCLLGSPFLFDVAHSVDVEAELSSDLRECIGKYDSRAQLYDGLRRTFVPQIPATATSSSTSASSGTKSSNSGSTSTAAASTSDEAPFWSCPTVSLLQIKISRVTVSTRDGIDWSDVDTDVFNHTSFSLLPASANGVTYSIKSLSLCRYSTDKGKSDFWVCDTVTPLWPYEYKHVVNKETNRSFTLRFADSERPDVLRVMPAKYGANIIWWVIMVWVMLIGCALGTVFNLLVFVAMGLEHLKWQNAWITNFVFGGPLLKALDADDVAWQSGTLFMDCAITLFTFIWSSSLITLYDTPELYWSDSDKWQRIKYQLRITLALLGLPVYQFAREVPEPKLVIVSLVAALCGVVCWLLILISTEDIQVVDLVLQTFPWSLVNANIFQVLAAASSLALLFRFRLHAGPTLQRRQYYTRLALLKRLEGELDGMEAEAKAIETGAIEIEEDEDSDALLITAEQSAADYGGTGASDFTADPNGTGDDHHHHGHPGADRSASANSNGTDTGGLAGSRSGSMAVDGVDAGNGGPVVVSGRRQMIAAKIRAQAVKKRDSGMYDLTGFKIGVVGVGRVHRGLWFMMHVMTGVGCLFYVLLVAVCAYIVLTNTLTGRGGDTVTEQDLDNNAADVAGLWV